MNGELTFAIPKPEAAVEPEDEYTGSFAGLRWFLDFQWLK